MAILIAGIIVFLGIHLVPSLPGTRSAMVNRFGEGPYKGLFSVAALAGLVLIVLGMMRAPFEVIYVPPSWGRHVTMVLMLPALILLAGANMPSNLKRFTRHPMLWGVTLWSVGHLLANGDKASLLLFSSLGLWALFDMWSANRRGAALSRKIEPRSKDLVLVAAGSVVYVVLLFAHPWFTGRPLLM